VTADARVSWVQRSLVPSAQVDAARISGTQRTSEQLVEEGDWPAGRGRLSRARRRPLPRHPAALSSPRLCQGHADPRSAPQSRAQLNPRFVVSEVDLCESPSHACAESRVLKFHRKPQHALDSRPDSGSSQRWGWRIGNRSGVGVLNSALCWTPGLDSAHKATMPLPGTIRVGAAFPEVGTPNPVGSAGRDKSSGGGPPRLLQKLGSRARAGLCCCKSFPSGATHALIRES
jgi:hypothetical protein